MQKYLHFRQLCRASGVSRSENIMNIIADAANGDEVYSCRRMSQSSPEEHAFCGCYKGGPKGRPRQTCCTCGERGRTLEWVWDVETKTNCTHLVNDNKDVRFHLHFSGGTAVIRGNRPITANQHYWEIKMTSLVYGTDMMVGIGTKNADIHKSSDKFCSVLGIDNETWGLSYTGLFHHQGVSRAYASGFGQGSIIGVHLDMWNGTLSFYKNRQPLGIACGGLKGKTLYPMVSSTAARSGMRIIHSVSFPSSLQFLCCVALRRAISSDKSVLKCVQLPPGMQTFLANNLSWLLGENDPVNAEGTSSQMFRSTPHCCKKPSCSHQHLTCDDCNTPVFSCWSASVNDVYSDESSSSPLREHVLFGPGVLLENHNPHQISQQEGASNDDGNETQASNSKKRKYFYEYISDEMSDDD